MLGKIGTAFAAGLLLLVGAAPAGAQDRPLHGVALVIGQSKYEQLPVLANPQQDARDIDRLFGDLGFDVDRVLNADGDELREAIARFEDEAKGADVAVVYYSGHGIEAGGQNFIAPIDTNLSTPQSAGASMIAVQPMLDELSKVAQVSIVLLDACRSDPFPPGQTILLPGETAPVAVGNEGLAPVRGPVPVARANVDPANLGSVIGFAAEPGEPALDGVPGENSPYAAALLKHFAAGGYSFGDIMTMVSEEVYLKTRAKQLPWTNSSLRRVLTFDAPAEGDADQGAIRTERRKLLLSIAGTPAQTQKYVEALAGQEQVPLDALYGMLNVLGVRSADDGGDLQDQLQKGAARLKELLADKPNSVTSDPDLERLSKLADDAEAEGAIALALKFRDQATSRADALLVGKQAEAANLKQDMLDIAATYGANAATALLNFDHLHAAELYGKAFETMKDWDADQAFTFKIGQGDALYDQGYYMVDNASLERAIKTYNEALALASRNDTPARWSEAWDRIGQGQQTLGDRLTDSTMLDSSLASYKKALEVRTHEATPSEWAVTENNLGNVLYTIGMRQRDLGMLRQAIAALDGALSVFSVETMPTKWAATQSNKAAIEIDLASLVYADSDSAEMAAAAGGSKDPTNIPEVVKARGDANAILGVAISALEGAVAVRGKDADPLDWAMIMHTLATGYEERGVINHASVDLGLAADAFRKVLTVHTKERTPAQWLRTSNNLAITLKHLADETSDPAPLGQAVAIYRSVVDTVSREAEPLAWADYQENLGNALSGLAMYDNPAFNLEAAVAAFRAAGEVTSIDRNPRKWQGLQTAMATALLQQGIGSHDKSLVLEAQRLTLAARDKLTTMGQPDDAFYSQFLPLIDRVLALFAE